jgi:hypothetical protein
MHPEELFQFIDHGGKSENDLNPFQAVASDTSIGGFLHFGNRINEISLRTLLNIAEVHLDSRDYAIFRHESENPKDDGYLIQMRLVSKFALQYLFRSITEEEYRKFKDQKKTFLNTCWDFIEEERDKYGTLFGHPKLAGALGGDGHYAQEGLAFGFMVENSYHRVYRIWSRAWLVTK